MDGPDVITRAPAGDWSVVLVGYQPVPRDRFDVVFNPVSNVFRPELAPVWRESFRVLRPDGTLLAGFVNPDVFIFDFAALERDELGWPVSSHCLVSPCPGPADR